MITLLRLIHPDDDLPHEEVHLDDKIPSDVHNIIVLGIHNNESFYFWDMTKIIIKCGRQMC
jgi:hypothetical protein